MCGRTLTGANARIRPFKQSSKETDVQVFSTGQRQVSRRFARGLFYFLFFFYFETRFHYTPEANWTLQQSSCFSLLSACIQAHATTLSKPVSRRCNWQTPHLLGRNSMSQHGSPHRNHLKASLCTERWKDMTLCQLFYNPFF